MVEQTFDLLYDCDKKAVGCVILQAAAGFDGSLLYEFGFDPNTWLTAPTPGMKRLRATKDKWNMAAAISNAAWHGKHAR